jgi:hypothetical protein
MTNDWYASLSPERLKIEQERRREKYNSISPEEKKIRSDKRKERDRKKMSKWTPEQWSIHRQKLRKRWKKYYDNLSSEEKETLREKIKLWKREDWHSLSPEKRQEELDRLKTMYIENRKNPEKVESERVRLKMDKQTIKRIVFTHYCNGEPHCMNPKCEVPGGTKNINGLCLEHINGGGHKHSKEINRTGTAYYRWVIQQGYPDGFQIFCATCNQVKKIEQEEDRKARTIRLKNNEASTK